MAHDSEAEAIASKVAIALERALGSVLLGVYPSGSMAFGDYQHGVSDVDLVAVCARSLDGAEKGAVVAAVRPAPATTSVAGIDLYVVSAATAARPTPDTGWEVFYGCFADHGWEDEVSLARSGEEADLTHLLALEIARTCGRSILGMPPGDLIEPVPATAITAACRNELGYWLREGIDHSPRTALLNACRAWRYAVEGALSSKLEGGAWARSQVDDPQLIDLALAAQRGESPDDLPVEPAMAFLRRVDAILATAS